MFCVLPSCGRQAVPIFRSKLVLSLIRLCTLLPLDHNPAQQLGTKSYMSAI